MKRVNPNARADIHMQTDRPGALGFQFTMFRPAGELKNEAVFAPQDLRFDEEESVEEGWDRKLRESHSSLVDRNGKPKTLYDDIAENGVSSPVLLHTGDVWREPNTIMNGHHRVAAAADADPKMEVPVAHGNFKPGSDYYPARPAPGNVLPGRLKILPKEGS